VIEKYTSLWHKENGMSGIGELIIDGNSTEFNSRFGEKSFSSTYVGLYGQRAFKVFTEGATYPNNKNSIDFAVSLYPNNIELFCLSVLPGTDLYEKAKSFGLEWKNEPPYTVIRTPEFSEIDLKKAASLSRAVNIFYTQGRAVSWFNSLIYVLKIKPSAFFEKFEKYLMEKNIEENECFNADRIRIWQKDFVKKLLLEKKLNRLVLCVVDLIEIYGALSDADGEGKSTVIKLNYWPEDLLSEYALDINFFAAKVKPHACKIKIKPSKDGAVWE